MEKDLVSPYPGGKTSQVLGTVKEGRLIVGQGEDEGKCMPDDVPH